MPRQKNYSSTPADEAMRTESSRHFAIVTHVLIFGVFVAKKDFDAARRALKTAVKIANAGGKEFAHWSELLVEMEKRQVKAYGNCGRLGETVSKSMQIASGSLPSRVGRGLFFRE